MTGRIYISEHSIITNPWYLSTSTTSPHHRPSHQSPALFQALLRLVILVPDDFKSIKNKLSIITSTKVYINPSIFI